MMLLILVGYVCFKIKMITPEVNAKLSTLVLTLVNPVLILTSYQIEFHQELLNGLMIAFLLAAGSVFLSIVLAQILIRKSPLADRPIERFSIIYSNCGFMGIPLVFGVFGAQGVFYLTSYMTVFNLLVWTHGIIIMKGEKSFKSILNVIKTPAILATVLGLALFITRITLPETLMKTLNYIGGMNTPLAMLVAGATIAQADIVKAFAKIRIYWVSLIRLLIVPVLTLLIFSRLQLDRTVMMTIVIASACPAAATGTLFAVKFGKNSLYASEIFATTTILSVVTLPLIVFLAGFF
jgi:predicted permease